MDEAKANEKKPFFEYPGATCPFRDRCMVPTGRWVGRRSRARWLRRMVPVSELDGYRCGFELVGTVKGCPKARSFGAEEDE